MRVVYISAVLALSLTSVCAPAMAADNPAAEVHRADVEVAHQAQLTHDAVKQGDPVTVAVAHAKLQAAQAVAWGKRHPAKTPATGVAVN